MGTQAWIYDLGYETDPEVTWKPWNYKDQTNGFLTKFKVCVCACVGANVNG